MKIITITSEKGGTGKTMIATHLAGLLAARGWRVLLVDADPQGHATISYGLPKEPGLYDLLIRGKDINQVVRQPAVESYALPGGIIEGKLYLVPSNEETYAIPVLLKDMEGISDALEELSDVIDIVVIDTPPTPGALMQQVYRATDYVLIPAKLELLALDGMTNTAQQALGFKHKDIRVMGIIPNLYKKTVLHQTNLANVTKWAHHQGFPVFPVIADRTLIGECSQNRRMVYTAEPQSHSAQELIRLAARVEQELAHV